MRAPLLVIALLGLTLAACGNDGGSDHSEHGSTTTGAATTTAAPAPRNLDATANGQRVAMRVGEEVTVSLAANPTTGYQWQLRELDQALVKQKDDPDFRPDPNPNNAVGVGGTSIWTFTAVAPGATKLVLGYLRPWEQGVEPSQTFTVTFDVTR
ncbi:protease inhibitor I42 family protein [Nocardia sp. CDC159]|uniref:Protease inhibitor I42 family protein n=1 Tax=Nocardia pulmonis TaxID=2951408 RepID=A0A9X2J105_9NOCA|nr:MULTISPECIES: protease inhibitor I42 family protein [Nocardia]MCM6776486.1 protease inhibitor I42 family protein [Nocardia pulmonis]MCM6788910.1 protease inhibitor I42 family protein [Nocardia sp. CDC159]